jgi:hypothetical protein
MSTTENSFEVTDADVLARLLVGRTIVAAERTPDTGEPFQLGENTVTLTLDDGAQVEFSGEGYDASACVTFYSAPDA